MKPSNRRSLALNAQFCKSRKDHQSDFSLFCAEVAWAQFTDEDGDVHPFVLERGDWVHPGDCEHGHWCVHRLARCGCEMSAHVAQWVAE